MGNYIVGVGRRREICRDKRFQVEVGFLYKTLLVGHDFRRFANRHTIDKRLLIGKDALHLHVLKQWTVNLVGALLCESCASAKNNEQEVQDLFHSATTDLLFVKEGSKRRSGLNKANPRWSGCQQSKISPNGSRAGMRHAMLRR
jgi:hypothetical protein